MRKTHRVHGTGIIYIMMYNLPSLKLTAKAPENGWLEYSLPFGILPIFRGKLAVSFREATHCEPGLHTQPGLSCKPSVRAHDAKRDLALCVASDGLWDFVEEKAFGETPGTFRFRCVDFFF